MATTAEVDVVPVALCDLHKWHPPSALMPLAVPRGVELIVYARVGDLEGDAKGHVEFWCSGKIESKCQLP